jgi:hypothetical protein
MPMMFTVRRDGEILYQETTPENGDLIIEEVEGGRLNIQGRILVEPPYSLEVDVTGR